MPKTTTEPEVTKRRVTMRSAVIPAGAVPDKDGRMPVQIHEAVDYVRPDFLDAYVVAARANWQSVEVSEEPDAGPGGYHGQTVVPENLNHPLAGRVFPATPEKER